MRIPPPPDNVLQDLLSRALDAIWIVDENDVIEYANLAAALITGYSVDELIGAPLAKVLPPEIAGRHGDMIRRYIDEGGESTILGRVRELELHDRSGEPVPIELKAFEIAPSATGRRFGAIMRSTVERRAVESERERLLARMTRLAAEDELTGMANRRAFFAALGKAASALRRHGREGCVAVIDIDFFKRVNDRHGHGAGDRVLASIANILKTTLRTEDVVGRIGGEEFALVMLETDLDTAAGVLERIRGSIADTGFMLPDGTALHVTVSAGIAPLDLSRPPEDSLKAADAALYDAKAGGRNRVLIAAPEDADAHENRRIS